MKRGDLIGFEKDMGTVNGKFGAGKVKWEGESDGRADALGKALSSAAEEGGPVPSLVSPPLLPDPPPPPPPFPPALLMG